MTVPPGYVIIDDPYSQERMTEEQKRMMRRLFEVPIARVRSTGLHDEHKMTERLLKTLEDRLLWVYTPPEAHQWLLSEQDCLGGRVPVQLIEDGRIAEVEEAIDSVIDGMFI